MVFTKGSGLQDQDVIYVPVYQTRVDVQGEVKTLRYLRRCPTKLRYSQIRRRFFLCHTRHA
ncbi:MAG: hypothetical protein M9959_14075 [Chitinophagaceae bacterium]|nr:hypothetical protein [Chitinophagaceae bacterium]